jgi:hypothetical protein
MMIKGVCIENTSKQNAQYYINKDRKYSSIISVPLLTARGINEQVEGRREMNAM